MLSVVAQAGAVAAAIGNVFEDAGTGFFAASLGRKQRAASLRPPLTGIQASSIFSTLLRKSSRCFIRPPIAFCAILAIY